MASSIEISGCSARMIATVFASIVARSRSSSFQSSSVSLETRGRCRLGILIADQVAWTDVQGARDLPEGGWQDVWVARLEAYDGGPGHAGALRQFRLGQRGPQPQLAQSSELRQSLPSVVSLF